MTPPPARRLARGPRIEVVDAPAPSAPSPAPPVEAAPPLVAAAVPPAPSREPRVEAVTAPMAASTRPASPRGPRVDVASGAAVTASVPARDEAGASFRGPRIVVVDSTAPRLDPAMPEAPLDVRPPRLGAIGQALAGVAVLAVGLSVLSVGNFVADQFARSSVLGWATLGIAGAGFGLLGAGVWRELRGVLGLRGVDRLRADLASGDGGRIRSAALDWAGEVPQAAGVMPGLRAANDPDAMLALLRAGPCEALRTEADALGRTAAVQMVAGIAAMPSPALDVALMTWRGVRLVRQVAALYGVRPGVVGTVSLLRRTLTSATLVGAAEVATNAAARAVLSNPLLAHALGEVAGAGVAARRMLVLARATAAACDPVPPG